MKLVCPINDCKWQYNSIFEPEGSLKIILIHVEKDHTPQGVQPGDTTVQSRSLTTHSIDVASQQGRMHPSTGLARAHLMKMKQGKHEPIRTFADKVQRKAQKCGFTKQFNCRCGEVQAVDYTDRVVTDVVRSGIASAEVRSTVL